VTTEERSHVKVELDRSYRVQLVGDPILCAELRQRLVYEPHFEIPDRVIHTSENLFETLYEARPDIVLLDMTLPDVGLYVGLTQMRKQLEVAPYIVAIAPTYEPHLQKMHEYRPLVRGTLLCRMALLRLLRPVMRGVATGCEYFIQTVPLEKDTPLTDYEYEVLLLMALGMDNDQMQRELDVSPQSIYNAQSKIRKKLEVKSNQKIVATAIRLGLVGVFTGPEDPTEPGMRLTVRSTA
jgi:DNA-binding NarL/FixJ family response regulator